MNAQAPPRVGYVYTRPLPSRETEPVQVLSTLDALAGRGVDVELVFPGRFGRGDSARPALEAEVRRVYGLRHPVRLAPLWTVQPTATHLERPVHAVTSVLLTGRRYDLVHTRSLTALAACVARGVPAVFETYRRLGHDAPGKAWLLARLASRPGVLGVVTHSRQAADSLAMAGVPRDKTHVIYNGHDPAKLLPRLGRDEARLRLGLPLDRPIAVYTGSLQAKKGVGSLIELAASTPEVQFVFVGGRAGDLATFGRKVRAARLDNVLLTGWRPSGELGPYLHAADVLLVPPTATPLDGHGITVLPMKIFTYLAAGRPILAPALPDLGEVLTDGVDATLVPPDDPDAACLGLRRILSDRAYADATATRALKASDALTWDARAGRLLGRYRAWLEGA